MRVRPLARADIPAFLDLIEALSDYENLPRPDAAARERLAADALGERPRFWVQLAERAGRVIGYVVYFETYSTILGRPTLYIEDIFVLPEERKSGAGRALMRAMAQEAVERGCGRIEWQVLTWNIAARAFYERMGAAPLGEWQPYRLLPEQFCSLAEADGNGR
ncbi:MAG: GNAT family N-acetyltransferase [Dehalococcoidales bacterium]|nr:GNAT family N-acetyltransferase [Dehalococcoidales bacterium]